MNEIKAHKKVQETPAEEPAAETKDEPEAAEATQTEDKDNNKTVKS